MNHLLLSLEREMLQLRFQLTLSFFIICLIRCTPSFSQDVTEEWARRYDHQGPGDEYFQTSVMDDDGNLYITSTTFTAPAYLFGAYNKQTQILTLKYSPAGELLWTSLFPTGGNLESLTSIKEARAIAVDESGGVYVAGVRKAETTSVYQNQDIILLKIRAEDGSQVWMSEYTEGESLKEVNGIALDKANNVYLTGTTGAGTMHADYLTIKYSGVSGERLWARQYDGTGGRDWAHSVAIDKNGGVFVTGKSLSEIIPSPGRGGSNWPVYNITTIKYDALSGEILWVSSYKGDTLRNPSWMEESERATLVLDDNGQVYVAGLQRGTSEANNFVTLKYNNEDGHQEWVARYPVNSEADPALTLDGLGGVYVFGNYEYNNLVLVKYNASNGERLWVESYTGLANISLTSPQVIVGSADDVFASFISSVDAKPAGVVTIKFNRTSGRIVWEKFFEGELATTGFYASNLAEPYTALLIDHSGYPYVVGSAYADNDRVNSNLFVLKYASSNGALIWEEDYEATGSTYDFVVTSAVDTEGNIYVAGMSESEGAGYDIVIVKYSTAGEELWVRSYDRGTEDRISAIALDGAGGVYIVGAAGNQRSEDYLTLKLNTSDGAVVWEALYDSGTNESDAARAIAVDESGGVFVTGMSYRASSTGSSDSDFATVKYNASDGGQVWVKRFGGLNMSEEASDIAVDKMGGVYVTGSAASNYTTIKYSAGDGEQIWVAHYDGKRGYDAAIALAIDNNNGVYVTGRSTGNNGQEDFATIKYDAAEGNQLWLSRYSSDNRRDIVNDIAVDKEGGIYVTGSSFAPSSGQNVEAEFITIKYNAVGGEQAWVQTYGEEGSESRAYAIVIDGVGGVYVSGQHIAGAISEKTGAAATLKYNAANGALEWAMLKEGIDESARTIGLDASGNVYVSGSSFSNETYGDFLTIKYSQNGNCTPVTAHGIKGATTVRAGTKDSGYALTGTGATSFNWSVSGDQSIPISDQGTKQIAVDWPTEAGIYEVGVHYSAGEACPAQDTTLTVAVFDPNAGFVIGAGGMESPVNPELPYMQTGGRAYFAFASWYAKDARTVPGYTAFHFSAGGLSFNSTTHTPMRLVISGNQANYTGRGMVNGEDGYGFLVAAVDEGMGQGRQQDRLRLKIWNIATGEVVYDNQAGTGEGALAATAITAGQIVIHPPLGRSIDALADAAETASKGTLPGKPQLQAYPTMFSGKATVTLALDREQEYTIGLYDLNGSLMRHIGSGWAQTGREYRYMIDGNGLAEGLYFVRLITGTDVHSVKIILKR